MVRVVHCTKAASRGFDAYGAIVDEDSLPAPGITNRPERQCRQIGRTADSSPRTTISLGNFPLAKLSSEIDKQLAIRRHIASARIHLPMKPLPTLKLVRSRVPQSDVPPFSWPTSENDADTSLLGQQHEHPTTICKERSQILDGCGHLWSAGRVPVTDLTVDTS